MNGLATNLADAWWRRPQTRVRRSERRTPMSWFNRWKTFSNLYTFHSSILRTSMKWVQGTRLSILSHELSYPFSGMFRSESAFPSCHGPDIDVYLTKIREERELELSLWPASGLNFDYSSWELAREKKKTFRDPKKVVVASGRILNFFETASSQSGQIVKSRPDNNFQISTFWKHPLEVYSGVLMHPMMHLSDCYVLVKLVLVIYLIGLTEACSVTGSQSWESST